MTDKIDLTYDDVVEQFMDGYLRIMQEAGLTTDEASMNYVLGRAIAEGVAQVQQPRVLHIVPALTLRSP